jgi:hypothetical protein
MYQTTPKIPVAIFMAYDFVGEEFGMGSAAQLFCAMWC